MTIANWCSVIGLGLDIAGAVVIYILPLQEDVHSKREINEHLEFFKNDFDESDQEKSKQYMIQRLKRQRLSKFGILLLILGFIFQLVSVIISTNRSC